MYINLFIVKIRSTNWFTEIFLVVYHDMIKTSYQQLCFHYDYTNYRLKYSIKMINFLNFKINLVLGKFIKDMLIPKAVLYYTGEMQESEEDELDFDSADEDDDDDNEDDDDEDESEEEDTKPTKKKVKTK